MYAFFLLAMLADVARAKIALPAEGDAGGGLTLNAASQLRAGAAGEAIRLPRRSNRLFPSVTRFRRSATALSGWARMLSGQANPSHTGMLAAADFVALGSTPASLAHGLLESPPISRAIFAHSGSPAP